MWLAIQTKLRVFFVNFREYQKDFPEPGVLSSKAYTLTETMTETKTTLQAVIDQTLAADLNSIMEFLLWKP